MRINGTSSHDLDKPFSGCNAGPVTARLREVLPTPHTTAATDTRLISPHRLFRWFLFSGNRTRFYRHFAGRRNFVFWLRYAEQPMIEPTDDVLQPFNAMPWLAGTREFVRLVRE